MLPQSPTPLPSDPLIGDVERFLASVVADLPPEPGDLRLGLRGRPRILPSLCLWSGLLVCVLNGFSSQLALWRLLAVEGLWDYPRLPISDQAVYKRLNQAGSTSIQWLFASVTTLLAERLAPWMATDLAPFASEVVAIDGTTMDPLARRLTDPADLPSVDAILPGKLLGLFDVRRQQWRRLLHRANPAENDKVGARELLDGLPHGSLILADLGFFAFQWFDDLTDAGHWWISRLRAKTSMRVVHTFYQDGDTLDQLVWLGAYRADRAKHVVRRVQYRHGGVLRSYLTNVLDPNVLTMHDIAVLYARRWDIEMAVQLVKQHLGVRLWWSSNLVVVEQQLWATLIIAQVVMGLRLEIAGRAGVDVFDVSLPLLVRYLPRYAARGQDPVEAFIRDGRLAKFIRPSRRKVIQTPLIDPTRMVPAPPELTLERTSRYAQRNCGPRSKAN
jgi:hypothetical protein